MSSEVPPAYSEKVPPQDGNPGQPQASYPAGQPQGMSKQQEAYSGQPQGGYQPQPGVYQPQVAYPGQTAAYQQQSNNVVVMTNQPMPGVQTVNMGIKPQNYLIFSIITLIFCCQLFGIIALIYSLQVDSAWNRGDVEGAKQHSRTSKNWNIAALVTGIVLIIFIVIIAVLANVIPLIIATAAFRG